MQIKVEKCRSGSTPFIRKCQVPIGRLMIFHIILLYFVLYTVKKTYEVFRETSGTEETGDH